MFDTGHALHQDHTVVVLGASPKPARYANQAVRLLKEHGYRVIPVHPRFTDIEGLHVAPSLRAVEGAVDTLTLYVGPERSRPLIDDIVALGPGRVIFNPGTESAELEARLQSAEIPFLHGCTLVMLRTRQF
jgi:predicted CoA-binding protein